MTLVVGNKYTGQELINFLKNNDELVILESGGQITEDYTYTVETEYNKCSLHQRKKHPVYETNPYTSKEDVVGYEKEYHRQDYKEKSIYIVR